MMTRGAHPSISSKNADQANYSPLIVTTNAPNPVTPLPATSNIHWFLLTLRNPASLDRRSYLSYMSGGTRRVRMKKKRERRRKRRKALRPAVCVEGGWERRGGCCGSEDGNRKLGR